MKYDIVAAIRLNGDPGVRFVGLVHHDSESWMVYWNCTESHGKFAKSQIEILSTYDPDNLECENELAYQEEYAPKPQEPCARLGFIALDGRWFPCAYTAHSALAYKLALLYTEEIGCSDLDNLLNAGWVGVHGHARIDTKRDKITPEQERTLSKIVEAFEIEEAKNPDIDWGNELLKNPEGYTEQSWSTAADGGLKMSTYAQSMRESFEWLRGNRHIAPREIITPFRAGRIREIAGD